MPNDKNIGFPVEDILPYIEDSNFYHAVFLWHTYLEIEFVWSPDPNIFVRDSLPEEIHGQGVWTNNQTRFTAKTNPLAYARTPAFIEKHEPPNVSAFDEWYFPQEFRKYKANYKAWAQLNGSFQIIIPGGYIYNQNFLFPWHITNTGAYIKDYIKNWKPRGQIWDISVYQIPRNRFDTTIPRQILVPRNQPQPIYYGTASPPPPPLRKMCGCDCNTIASIIAEQMAEKQRLLDAIKEHIDSRAIEQLEKINEMLQSMELDVDLQPVIDEIKRAEANLWNGINGG